MYHLPSTNVLTSQSRGGHPECGGSAYIPAATLHYQSLCDSHRDSGPPERLFVFDLGTSDAKFRIDYGAKKWGVVLNHLFEFWARWL
jgi:hypothetical protein